MSPLAIKLFFTGCSLIGGSFLYVLQILSWDEFHPAIIGPMIGFSFGAVLVIYTIWRAPRGVHRAYGRDPSSWATALFSIWAFLAPYAATFMVWVTLMFVLGAPFLILDVDIESPLVPIFPVACFAVAVILVPRLWPCAMTRA